MKLKDITVGGEYLLNTNRDWETQSFTASNWGNRRVRVLEATNQRWVFNSKTKTFEKASVYSSRARKGIVVMILDPETGKDAGQDVATLGGMRGPWEEFSKKVTAAREAKQKVENLMKAAKGVRQEAMKGILELAAKLGVKARCERYDNDGNVVVAPAVFMEMLTALEASGWKSSDGQ